MAAKPRAYMTQQYSDDMLKIAAGIYPGISAVNKFGRNPDVASGVKEEIWDGSAAYVFPATALMTKMSQTTNQAAMVGKTVEVQGLNSSWEAVTQTVTLNGSDTTTAVTLGTPLIRANRMKVTTSVVTDQDIRLHNTAENQDYSLILAGFNQTQQAIYTVPLGKTAYVTNYWAAIIAGGGNPTSCPIALWAKDNANGYAAQIKHSLGIDLDYEAKFQHPFEPYYPFPAQTDIFVTATPVAAAATVSAGFDLILVDD